MIWDYKNIKLKRFIQKTFSIKDEVPDTIKEEGHVWVKTRRIISLYCNEKTGKKKIVDNDLYEFEYGKQPGQTFEIDGEVWRWERNLSGFATIVDLNGVFKRLHKDEIKFTKPPIESDGSGYGIT
jgi:RNase P/RNase MRP subunit p29